MLCVSVQLGIFIGDVWSYQYRLGFIVFSSVQFIVGNVVYSGTQFRYKVYCGKLVFLFGGKGKMYIVYFFGF